MTNTTTKHSPIKIDNTLLVVDPQHPLETLPFISDALAFIDSFIGLIPPSLKIQEQK